MTKITLLMPKATTLDPYKELNWIFGILEREKPTMSINYAKLWYITFIRESLSNYPEFERDPRFIVSKYWKADALILFTQWLNAQNDKLTSKSRYSVYKIVRTAMDWAYELGIINNIVYHAPMFKGVAETDSRSPFSEDEQSIINVALTKWVMHAKRVSEAYKKSGKGIPVNKPNRNPIHINGKDYSIKQASKKFKISESLIGERRKRGWTDQQLVDLKPAPVKNKSSDNVGSIPILVEGVLWPSTAKAAAHYGVKREAVSRKIRLGYTPEQAIGLVPINSLRGSHEAMLYEFEERFECDPLKMLLADRIERINENIFSSKKLMKFFLKIGVWPSIDRRIIMPLAAEICRLTGLNAESVASLTTNCYVPKHPLTNQPCIVYTKTRSSSTTRSEEKELHLNLLSKQEYFINDNLQERINEIINLTLDLTAKIRSCAKGETANRLFIYEHDAFFKPHTNRKRVTHIIWGTISKDERDDNPDVMSADKWTNYFCEDNNLFELLGKNFRFNFSRFRSTLANNMIKEGADIFDIQIALGHGSVMTTATYLSEKELDPTFKKVVLPALNAIASQKADTASDEHEKIRQNDTNGYTETLCGTGCQDAFNPSKKVRDITGHIEGSPCKYWNMCLLCEQSTVTENSLPKIIAYKWKLNAILSEDRSNMIGRKKLYEEILTVIDDLTYPGHYYPESVLNEAKYIASELDDEALDHLVYQGI
tara:strand:- start:60868 stop:63000 length:2133 start_codon:yes stop_codon:yes gene_type:complete